MRVRQWIMRSGARAKGRGAGLPGALAAVSVALLATIALATPAQAGSKADTKSPSPSSGPAAEAVPGGFATWADLFATQDKLNAAANRILQTDSTGYAGIVAAPESRQLRVYWKGSVPAAVTSLVGQLGVPVSFLPARFTQRELVAEAQRLAADARVATAAPEVDGSGVEITVTTTRGTSADVLSTARVPLNVTTGQRPQNMFSRQNDIPLFWGGSRYNTPVGGCSNGFALSVPGAPNVYEISAGHCGNNGQGATIPGQPSPTGTIVGDVNARDTLAINYPAGVYGAIYNGPWNSSTAVGVGGAVADFVGNFICTGGASSGEHCGIQVQAVDQFINVGIIIGPETRAALPAGQCAVAPGDSGGPAYSYRSDGRVNARGTISAGILGTAVCPGVVANGSSTVWYAPLLRPAGDPQIGSLQFYGVGILTG
jgi:hypothetical protein